MRLQNEKEKAHMVEWQLQDLQQPIHDKWHHVQSIQCEDHGAW